MSFCPLLVLTAEFTKFLNQFLFDFSSKTGYIAGLKCLISGKSVEKTKKTIKALKFLCHTSYYMKENVGVYTLLLLPFVKIY